MEKERLEQKLRDFLKTEVKRVEPSSEWWSRVISRLGEQGHNSIASSFWNFRPLIAVPLSIFLLVVLAAGLVPMMGGKATSPPQPPALVADGNGGFFVFWNETPYDYGNGLFANHVDSTGNYLWGLKGKQIAEGKLFPPQAISDNVGGAIVAWGDSDGFHIQRLSSSSDSLWKLDQASPRSSLRGITSDGNTGAIILWQDRNEQVYVQRVSAEGVSLWGESGTSFGRIQTAYMGIPIVSDNQGGALIMWFDPFKGIFAQRLSQSGQVLWANGGVPVTSPTREIDRPQLINDGSDNFIITWSLWSTNTDYSWNIYAQKLDTDGKRLWGEKGILIDSNSDHETQLRDSKLTADGSGGCIVVWRENQLIKTQQKTTILAQRINARGQIQWTEGGVPVSATSQNINDLDFGLIYITGDGNGNSIVIWVSGKDVFIQKLDFNGKKLWSEGGMKVYQNAPFRAVGRSNVISDGNGGFVIGSRVSKDSSVFNTDSIYMQRISSSGDRLWGNGGMAVQVKSASPVLPVIATGLVLFTALILIGVFRGSRLAWIFTAIAPVFLGMIALFSILMLFGGWPYFLWTPINQAAGAIIPFAGLTIVAVGIWKRTVTKWIMVPILIFCILIAIIGGLIFIH
jgi:hypothetical protein